MTRVNEASCARSCAVISGRWWIFLLFLLLAVGCRADLREPRRPIVLAHYMPWFQADPAAQRWGWHWTMNAFDPAKVDATGRRDIAAAAYPVIGPYDSGDRDVIEYHLLLMKLAGIDGVVIDWYGRADLFDYADIHRNTQRVMESAERIGLLVAICYEDQTIGKLVEAGRVASVDRVAHARREIEWLSREWFTRPCYLLHDGRPVLLSFGNAGLTDEEWAQTLQGLSPAPAYLSEHRRRPCAEGGFDWPQPAAGVAAQQQFLTEASTWRVAMASAYPRLEDSYRRAGVGPGYGVIADRGGATFRDTLIRAHASGLPYVQLCTWNDWGEGTQVEPSREFGYRDLEVLLSGRNGGSPRVTAADLRLPETLLRLRREVAEGDAPARGEELDRIARLLAAGRTAEARASLERLQKRRR